MSAIPSSALQGGAARDVVLVTLDTLRWDALGFMGSRVASTPNLDRVAGQGRVFERAWAHNVMTLPSHANILTGQLPHQHGIRDNAGFSLRADTPTLATRFEAAGFATAAFVSAFPLDSRYGLARGFDVYDDRVPEGSERAGVLPERPGHETIALALEWWRAHGDRQRFLWVHLFDPHAPYDPPEPHASAFRQRPYDGEVAATDAYLGPLLDGLDRASTLLAITSDHGEALGDHGEQTHGLFAYDSTLRVPLVLWGHGIEPGRTLAPAAHVDLFPTLVAAAGLEPPTDVAGRDLRADLPLQRRLYFEALGAHLDRDWAPLRGMLDGRYKYIDLPIAEYYDLRNDPAEQELLETELRSPRAQELRAAIPEESAWPPNRATLSDEERRKLQALGYLGSTLGTSGDAEPRTYGPADDPKTLLPIDQLMHRFMATYQGGQLAEAEALARELVQKQPKLGDGHYHLARVLLDQGRSREALRAMTTAYRDGVRHPTFVRQLALTLAESGQAPQAVAVLRELDASRDPRTLNALGLVLSEAGQLAEAEQVLRSVFEIDARNSAAHENLALVGVRRGRWAVVAREAQRSLDLDSSRPLAWNYLAMAQYNLGRKTEALSSWETSLGLAMDFDVLYNFAMVASEAAHPRAREALETFIAQAPAELYGPDIERAKTQLSRLGGAP